MGILAAGLGLGGAAAGAAGGLGGLLGGAASGLGGLLSAGAGGLGGLLSGGAAGAGGLAELLGPLLKSGGISYQNDNFRIGFDPQRRKRQQLIDDLLRTLSQPTPVFNTGTGSTSGGSNQTQSAITPIPSFNTGFGSSGGPFGLGGLRNLLGS